MLCLTMMRTALGQESEAGGQHPWIDGTHESISGWVTGGCDRMDRYIDRYLPRQGGDHTRLFEEQVLFNGTRIMVAPGVELMPDGTDVTLRFRVKLDLPRLEDRVQVFFDNLHEEREPLTDLTGSSDGEQAGETTAGLLFTLARGLYHKLDLSAGLGLSAFPLPELRLRARLMHRTGDWCFGFSESVFWEEDAGFGEKTRLDIGRELGAGLTAQSSAELVWSQEEESPQWGIALGLRKRLPDDRQVGLKAGAVGTIDDAAPEEYTARLPYRRKLYDDWVYLEIEPGIDFARERDYAPEPLLQFRLEFMFGAEPR